LFPKLSKELPNVKVLVCYHKKYKTLSNNVYKPIIVGNALKEKTIIQGALKDDDGINISLQNPYFCELTAQYWAWKNSEKINNPDYIGLMHYRRYLWFGQKINKIEDYIDERVIQKACASGVDIILPTATDIYSRTKKKVCVNFAEQYSIEQHIDDLETIRKIIKEYYPQYYRAFITTAYSIRRISWCNVLVAKKSVFDEYSEFLFGVLFAAEKEIPYLARIAAVADTYDAMTSTRPYRTALSHEVAISEIKRCAGTQFDPKLAELFVKLSDKIDAARKNPEEYYKQYSLLGKNIDFKISSEESIQASLQKQ